MKFSMIFEAQLANPTPERERQLIHDCVDQAVLAEEAGFDRIWAVEHHALKWYAHMSAPEIFLTAVAAKTSRIRIGHGAVCMPFKYNHPIRVAERAAMLDIISGGRLDIGAARGGVLQEMSLCGVDPETTLEEVEEALRIIGRVWHEDTFEWHGRLTVKAPEGRPAHSVVPRPVQLPHPPLFLACSKPDTVVRAARYGVGPLVMGFAGPEHVALTRRIYDEARAERTGSEFVSTEVNDQFCALCPTITLKDRAEARRIGARGQRFFGESINHWVIGSPRPAEDTENDDNAAIMKELADEVLSKLARGELPALAGIDPQVAVANLNVDHAYGDTGDAIAYVERLAQAGVDEIMCLIQMGTVPQEVCLETIRLWGEEVIPHFRQRADGEVAAVTGAADGTVA